jgi:hypothetical protein
MENPKESFATSSGGFFDLFVRVGMAHGYAAGISMRY